MKTAIFTAILVSIFVLLSGNRADQPAASGELLANRFEWTAGPPLVVPVDRDGDHYFSMKDPSIVRYQGRWHSMQRDPADLTDRFRGGWDF